MVADGFYIVKKGEFENIYKKTKTGRALKKLIKKDLILIESSIRGR